MSPAKNEFRQYAEDTDEVAFALLSGLYEITLNGEPCEVRDCRVSAYPFNRPWTGKQRDFSQTESAGYIAFSADESVRVCVKAKKAFSKAWIRPISRGIAVAQEDGAVAFTLEKAGSYVLELDSSHTALHIFFNPVNAYPDKETATYYFGAGIH